MASSEARRDVCAGSRVRPLDLESFDKSRALIEHCYIYIDLDSLDYLKTYDLVTFRLGTHDLETHNLETFDLLERLCIHLEFCAKSQAFLEHRRINLDYYLEF